MIVEEFNDLIMDKSEKTLYIRYRLGRLKHQLWLTNRKNKEKIVIDEYDYFILKNLKVGRTCIFGSAGYYMEDCIKDLTVIEEHEIVKKFYPSVIIIQDRDNFKNLEKFDNFVVINNRSDMWHSLDELKLLLKKYTLAMNDGCLFFYSFRDTQIPNWNRLTEDHYKLFYTWGLDLKSIDLHMIWHDIKFAIKKPDENHNYDGLENPDTTNGNIKFVFQYKKDCAKIL